MGFDRVLAHIQLPGDLAVTHAQSYQLKNLEFAAGDVEVSGNVGQESVGPEAALTALLGWMDREGLEQLVTTTQLLITPGYRWKIARALITNFHQPESTLLLLVASLIGEDWRKVYGYALEHGFRFLSYGDGCLLFGADGSAAEQSG